MGRGREVSFNASKYFSAFLKISPCGKFKKFKANKVVLTIVIDLDNILHWNLVMSAIEKQDSSVLCIAPSIFFFISNFSV